MRYRNSYSSRCSPAGCWKRREWWKEPRSYLVQRTYLLGSVEGASLVILTVVVASVLPSEVERGEPNQWDYHVVIKKMKIRQWGRKTETKQNDEQCLFIKDVHVTGMNFMREVPPSTVNRRIPKVYSRGCMWCKLVIGRTLIFVSRVRLVQKKACKKLKVAYRYGTAVSKTLDFHCRFL